VCTVTADDWDDLAETFDEAADHGLRDPVVREAWRRLLLPELPPAPALVADLGCGTGSLACLLAGEGHQVRGIDLAPRMVEAARAKAVRAGVEISFQVGDAAAPPWPDASVDVVLARHVLWALGDPDAAVARWVRLLRPGGRLVLVEGRWHTGAGMTSQQARTIVERHRRKARVRQLPDPDLWGGAIADERYLLVSER
jgi:ubiquinone/menaquinone biosynthesis C-methylase UbiE